MHPSIPWKLVADSLRSAEQNLGTIEIENLLLRKRQHDDCENQFRRNVGRKCSGML
jgi:hypothetical protein